MTRILHVSDLHYGRVDPDLEPALLGAIADLAPDLVVVSGDLTQRALAGQFEAARAFLDRIESPVFCVPGNHDVPLHNPLARFVQPFALYRRHIDSTLEPVWENDTVTVIGVNTVNRFAWQSGRISRRTVGRVCAAFQGSRTKLQIVVLHHPLEHAPDVEKRLMRGARHALGELAQCGADVALSGHLHQTSAKPFTAQPGLLFVQAGTGLSTRLRGEDNTFNLLVAEPDRIGITTWRAGRDGGAPRFAPAEAATYERGPDGWRRSSPRLILDGSVMPEARTIPA